jgi:hypothetical protein
LYRVRARKDVNQKRTGEVEVMKTRNYLAVMVLFVSVGALMTGCSTAGPDLVASGSMNLEKANTPGVRVMYAELRQDASGGTIAKGRLVQTGARTLPRNGHVGVQLFDAGGKAVAKACSAPIKMSFRGPGRGLKTRSFAVRIDAAAPRGGKALVAYHLAGDCDS